MSPPVSAASSDSFQLRTWLEAALYRVMQFRSTFPPMSETTRIVHKTHSNTLPRATVRCEIRICQCLRRVVVNRGAYFADRLSHTCSFPCVKPLRFPT